MRAFLIVACVLSSLPAAAKVKTELVEYRDGDVVLEGVLAYDDANKDKRPGIVLGHDWMGVGPFSNKKAEDLAALGYVAFVADVYGKGVRPKDRTEAGALAGKFKGDRAAMRKRMRAAYDVLARHALVDNKRTAAMGFCFGGTAALELMRSGAPLAGVVSFHGGLDAPSAPAVGIKSKVLVLHGADDPGVPPAEVAGFKDEMRHLKLDYQVVEYGGAVHSFTNPAAGNDPAKGSAYDENADKRSWSAMRAFFDEIF